MTPSIIEVIFWCVFGGIGLLVFMIGPFINPYYDPKNDDPYRYCPKEDEE